jgi:hypothetical protein
VVELALLAVTVRKNAPTRIADCAASFLVGNVFVLARFAAMRNPHSPEIVRTDILFALDTAIDPSLAVPITATMAASGDSARDIAIGGFVHRLNRDVLAIPRWPARSIFHTLGTRALGQHWLWLWFALNATQGES